MIQQRTAPFHGASRATSPRDASAPSTPTACCALPLAVVAALGMGLPSGAPAQQFPAELDLSTLDGTNGFVLNGEAAGDRSGASVSAAGDVNGDGTTEIADLLDLISDFGGECH